MPHEYDELIPGSIYMGAAADISEAVSNEGIQTVVDLRHESQRCASDAEGVNWIKVPLGDNSPTAEAELFDEAINHVIAEYRAGRKVMFHCGLGRGRTGTVAAGVLRRLGEAQNLVDAERQAKAIRPQLSIQQVQHEALRQIFGE